MEVNDDCFLFDKNGLKEVDSNVQDFLIKMNSTIGIGDQSG